MSNLDSKIMCKRRSLLGLIFETELDNEEKFFQAGLEKYCRQVR